MSEVEFKGVPSDKPTPDVPAPPARLTESQALAIQKVVERTRNDVWRIVSGRAGRDLELANDALQETYLTLMQRWPGNLALYPEDQLLHWLRGTAKLKWYEQFRKRAGGRVGGRNRVVLSRDGDISALQADTSHPLVESSAGEQDFREDLLEAVATLKGQKRSVMELMVMDLDDTEIAAQLGIKPVTVRSHRMLAFAKLRLNPALRKYVKNQERG